MSQSAQSESFLEMMAAERGAAVNTLAAYRRDLEDLVLGRLAGGGHTDIGKGAWHKVQFRPNRLSER